MSTNTLPARLQVLARIKHMISEAIFLRVSSDPRMPSRVEILDSVAEVFRGLPPIGTSDMVPFVDADGYFGARFEILADDLRVPAEIFCDRGGIRLHFRSFEETLAVTHSLRSGALSVAWLANPACAGGFLSFAVYLASSGGRESLLGSTRTEVVRDTPSSVLESGLRQLLQVVSADHRHTGTIQHSLAVAASVRAEDF